MGTNVTRQDAENALIYKDGILDYDAHDAYLTALGYSYLALPCACGGSDDDGHLPSCGWGKMEPLTAQPCPNCNAGALCDLHGLMREMLAE